MHRRGALAALHVMNGSEDQNIDRATERLRGDMEKGFSALRIEMEKSFGAIRAEIGGVRTEIGGVRTEIGEVRTEIGAVRTEIGGVRAEIGGVRTEMEKGFGALRAEMIDRDASLLKWFLVYAATQTGVIAALLALFR